MGFGGQFVKSPIPTPRLKINPVLARWLPIMAWALGLAIMLGLEAASGAIGLWRLAPGTRFAFAAFGAVAIVICAGLAWLIAVLAPRRANTAGSGGEPSP